MYGSVAARAGYGGQGIFQNYRHKSAKPTRLLARKKGKAFEKRNTTMAMSWRVLMGYWVNTRRFEK